MSNAVVIESLDPPVMSVAGCVKCGAACGREIALEWGITIDGRPTAISLHFCTPCAIDYLSADATRTQEFEREIGVRLMEITADMSAAAIAGPAAGTIQ